jgi:hypothetical protein
LADFVAEVFFALVIKTYFWLYTRLSCKDVGGPHRLKINSLATSVMSLRLSGSAVFGVDRVLAKNYHQAILDFCNKRTRSADADR